MTTTTSDRTGTQTRRGGLAHRLYTGEISYDFVGHRRLWYIVSAILLSVSLGGLLLRGLDLGIEFRGGSDFQAPVRVTSSTVSEVRSVVEASGVPNLGTTVTTIGNDRVRVQTRSLEMAEQAAVRGVIAQHLGIANDQVAYQLIGASWGKQITQKAGIALVVFLVLVGVLIWLYFRDAKMSIAALVALAHDLVVTVGVYALVGFTITPSTVIGVLTILGYSLYDTVVVFDKVRENVAEMEQHKLTYSEAANAAVNQVLVRSLNTTVIGVLPVTALLFAGAVVLGSGPLEDLGLALFVGMIAGAYSSVFIATPLLAQMRERESGMQTYRARLERRRAADAQKASAKALVEVPQRRSGKAPVVVTVPAKTSQSLQTGTESPDPKSPDPGDAGDDVESSAPGSRGVSPAPASAAGGSRDRLSRKRIDEPDSRRADRPHPLPDR